jgi:4-aminobutyrate aminotransferase-like enzyme
MVRAAADDLAARGHRPALLLADSGFTSEGVHDAPASYLAGLLAGAHAEGALYLADEVQIGYGRTGPAMWRFAASGVVPDLVTLGKPMGAGYPIGAVVTRREIVDRFAQRWEYFSTFAATPAAAAAGNAVLDVLEDRRLPEKALVTGAYLASRLRDLSGGSDLLGDVRAIGLVAGIDVVDRPTAHRLLQALVAQGALAGLTGPGGNVLKVRPPLVWDESHVDVFVDALARALEV